MLNEPPSTPDRYRGWRAPPDDLPPPGTETSIVAALRARLNQIAELRAALRQRDRTIATLHGELEKRTELRPASAAVIADDPRAVTEQRGIPCSRRPRKYNG
jgi:hypothetical protein